MSDPVLFDTQFSVTAVDPDGKKFDRVSRIVGHSSSLDMNLSLDVATDIYPIHAGQTLTLQLASTLDRAGSSAGKQNGVGDGGEQGGGTQDAAGREAWRHEQSGTLADDFDYVMYGKIYKYDDTPSETITVYTSFGGLLMALTGSYRHMSNLSVGSNVYLLVR